MRIVTRCTTGPRTRRTRLLLAAVAGVALLVPAGCVSLPESGPVVATGSQGSDTDEPGTDINPKPPQDGDPPGEIVRGFLDAMTAAPIRTDVARQFLSEAAAASWDPAETITYDDAGTPRGTTQVSLTLTGANRLDSRGAWQGPIGLPDETLTFPMTLEGEQWRIADPPDALIVPSVWFEQRYRQVSLYFFDPSARILVPEPVFVPRGNQLVTNLVTGLLRGPGSALSRVSSSFIPSDLKIDLSVPVSADGVADISLDGETGQLSDQVVELMVAQFAWTLRQEPSITSFRLSIGGRPVQLGDGQSEFSVDDGSGYDPSGFQSTSLLYGVQDGLLVSGPPSSLDPVDGPFGVQPYSLTSVAVNLTGTTAAGVSGDGTSLLLAPVRGEDGAVTPVAGAWTSLLRPAWDYSERLWIVDRTAAGARVAYVGADGVARDVDVPGVSGRDVREFLVSRDGSRLVAVVHRPQSDRIVVSRIRQDDSGGILSGSPAFDITGEDSSEQMRVKDLGWRSPTSVAVLHRVAKEFFEISTIAVDGAPTGLDALASTLRGRVAALVSSPAPGEKLYALSGSTLVDQSVTRDAPVSLRSPVESLDYVG